MASSCRSSAEASVDRAMTKGRRIGGPSSHLNTSTLNRTKTMHIIVSFPIIIVDDISCHSYEFLDSLTRPVSGLFHAMHLSPQDSPSKDRVTPLFSLSERLGRIFAHHQRHSIDHINTSQHSNCPLLSWQSRTGQV